MYYPFTTFNGVHKAYPKEIKLLLWCQYVFFGLTSPITSQSQVPLTVQLNFPFAPDCLTDVPRVAVAEWTERRVSVVVFGFLHCRLILPPAVYGTLIHPRTHPSTYAHSPPSVPTTLQSLGVIGGLCFENSVFYIAWPKGTETFLTHRHFAWARRQLRNLY